MSAIFFQRWVGGTGGESPLLLHLMKRTKFDFRFYYLSQGVEYIYGRGDTLRMKGGIESTRVQHLAAMLDVHKSESRSVIICQWAIWGYQTQQGYIFSLTNLISNFCFKCHNKRYKQAPKMSSVFICYISIYFFVFLYQKRPKNGISKPEVTK